jgi:hypothetical protein
LVEAGHRYHHPPSSPLLPLRGRDDCLVVILPCALIDRSHGWGLACLRPDFWRSSIRATGAVLRSFVYPSVALGSLLKNTYSSKPQFRDAGGLVVRFNPKS